jgi:hypothetical protein
MTMVSNDKLPQRRAQQLKAAIGMTGVLPNKRERVEDAIDIAYHDYHARRIRRPESEDREAFRDALRTLLAALDVLPTREAATIHIARCMKVVEEALKCNGVPGGKITDTLVAMEHVLQEYPDAIVSGMRRSNTVGQYDGYVRITMIDPKSREELALLWTA